MHKRLILSLLLLCPVLAHAQIPVTDTAHIAVSSYNASQSTISAVQNVIQAVESVFQSAQWVLDLTPTETIGGGLGDDLAALMDIVAQAEGLSYDMGELQSQINTLFNLDTPPPTTIVLRERLGEIRRIRHQGYSYAMKTQTLLATASRTAEHVMALLESIAAYVGNLSGTQRLSESVHTMTKAVTNQQVATAAFERALSTDKMELLLIEASLHTINNRVWDRE